MRPERVNSNFQAGLTAQQRAAYLKWIKAGPQRDPAQEGRRLEFLREFHVPTAVTLLREAEPWPDEATEPEPGEVDMQRWFRMMRLKLEARGELTGRENRPDGPR